MNTSIRQPRLGRHVVVLETHGMDLKHCLMLERQLLVREPGWYPVLLTTVATFSVQPYLVHLTIVGYITREQAVEAALKTYADILVGGLLAVVLPAEYEAWKVKQEARRLKQA
jgi:hypothetical protein